MSIGKRAFRAGAAASLACIVAVSAQADNLADTMAAAYKYSGLLDQNRATLRAADENVAQAVAALRPVLNWSGDVTRGFGNSATAANGFNRSGFASTTASINLIAQITLFDGGGNKLRLAVQKESVLATRAALVSVEQQVLLRAVVAFLEVRRERQNVSLRENNVRVIRQELRAARERFQVGEVTRTDVALAEARLSAARSNFAAAQGALQSAIEEYRAATGRKPGQLVPPKSLPNLPASVEAAKLEAQRNHPDMLQAQRLVTVNELGIAIAKSAMKPTVTLNGRVGVTENFNSSASTRSGSISLETSGPIYQGGRLSSLVRQAMAQRDEARGRLHVVRQNLAQNVGNVYVQMRVARATREAFQDQVRAARVAFRGVREEATLGARTTLDVLDAEQELLDAQAALISAQVDEFIAAYSALAALGRLTADGLKLNVPRYDPAQYYNLVKDAPTLSRQGEQLDRVLKALGKQ